MAVTSLVHAITDRIHIRRAELKAIFVLVFCPLLLGLPLVDPITSVTLIRSVYQPTPARGLECPGSLCSNL
jgi:hypothetical protein